MEIRVGMSGDKIAVKQVTRALGLEHLYLYLYVYLYLD